MKTCILLIVWLICVCIESQAQNAREMLIAEEGKGERAGVESNSLPFETGSHLSTATANTTGLPAPNHNQAYFIQKSKFQKLQGMVLLTGGSVMSYLGIRSALDINESYRFTKSPVYSNTAETCNYSKLAFTGLVMIAGSIPYFLNAIKNKKLAGLKLACQKTTFGANNKACKKVTGLTFAIPIGK